MINQSQKKVNQIFIGVSQIWWSVGSIGWKDKKPKSIKQIFTSPHIIDRFGHNCIIFIKNKRTKNSLMFYSLDNQDKSTTNRLKLLYSWPAFHWFSLIIFYLERERESKGFLFWKKTFSQTFVCFSYDSGLNLRLHIPHYLSYTIS